MESQAPKTRAAGVVAQQGAGVRGGGANHRLANLGVAKARAVQGTVAQHRVKDPMGKLHCGEDFFIAELHAQGIEVQA